MQEMNCFFLSGAGTPKVWLITAFCTGSICNGREGRGWLGDTPGQTPVPVPPTLAEELLQTPAELVAGVRTEQVVGARRDPGHRGTCAAWMPLLVLFKPTIQNKRAGAQRLLWSGRGDEAAAGCSLWTPSSPGHCAPVSPPCPFSPDHRHQCPGWQIIGIYLSSQLLPSTS